MPEAEDPAPASAAPPTSTAAPDLPPTSAAQPGDPSSVRLDVWLHAVRLAPTRAAATADCRGGHVRLNGQAVKAAQPVRIGDEIRVRRPGHERVVRVRRLLARRVGAPIARTTYEDLTPPPAPQLLARPPRRDVGAGRPTKKERREIDRLQGRS